MRGGKICSLVAMGECKKSGQGTREGKRLYTPVPPEATNTNGQSK